MGKQAGILIIGNEILSGKTVDTNSAYLSRELRTLGVEVREIAVIPDEIPLIAEKSRELSNRFDLVFTSGGVGPTHDDVTMEGIAAGFHVKVIRHPILVEILKGWYKIGELNEARLKMAEVPEGSELQGGEALSFPVVVFRNLYILPGIPEILREKFQAVRESFREEPFHLRIVYVKTPEGTLASHMNELLQRFPKLMVGSYPVLNNPDYRVRVTLESKEETYLKKAVESFLQALPNGALLKVE